MSLIPSGELKETGEGLLGVVGPHGINESNSLRGVESATASNIQEVGNAGINESNSLRGVESR